MGISQSLLKATNHSKFPKVQYGADTQITVATYQMDDFEFNKWRLSYRLKYDNKLGQVQKKKYPSLLLIPDEKINYVRDGFCSQKCKILIKLQKVWETTLQQQITKRNQIQRYYSEEEIWLILLNVSQTLVLLHQINQTNILGNIHPANTLMSKDGELLLIAQQSLPFEKDHFMIFKDKGMNSSYISPELVCFVNNKFYKQYPNYPACVNKQKAQSYSLGLMLLSICCLQSNLDPYYQLTKKNINYVSPQVSRQASSRHNYSNLINQEFFLQKLNQIKNRYSRVLFMIIKGFLQDLPENRLSVIQLWDVLLKEKQNLIKSKNIQWFFQTLQPIDQSHENQMQEEEDEQRQRQQQAINSNRFLYGNYGNQTNLQTINDSNDQRIEIWERSLQKYPQYNEQIKEESTMRTTQNNNNINNKSKIKFTYN